jgi:2-oxoglutarate ferredoxin oxidoreductase subunit beta
MTNGQYSPTTPTRSLSATSLTGNLERTFDLCKLVMGAGATYAARITTYHIRTLSKYIVSAYHNKGFSFIDVITQCPTYFGRKNKMAQPTQMLEWMKERSITIREAEELAPEALAGRFVIGEFINAPAPEYTQEYEKLIERSKSKGGR